VQMQLFEAQLKFVIETRVPQLLFALADRLLIRTLCHSCKLNCNAIILEPTRQSVDARRDKSMFRCLNRHPKK